MISSFSYTITSNSKRGRPRRQRPTIDYGTIELQQKRSQILQNAIIKKPEAVNSVLGVLYAHNIITKGMLDAGIYYAGLKYNADSMWTIHPMRTSILTRIGRPRCSHTGFPIIMENTKIHRQQQKWLEAYNHLKSQGKLISLLVETIVLNNKIPTEWYGCGFSEINFGPLLTGLSALEDYFFCAHGRNKSNK